MKKLTTLLIIISSLFIGGCQLFRPFLIEPESTTPDDRFIGVWIIDRLKSDGIYGDESQQIFIFFENSNRMEKYRRCCDKQEPWPELPDISLWEIYKGEFYDHSYDPDTSLLNPPGDPAIYSFAFPEEGKLVLRREDPWWEKEPDTVYHFYRLSKDPADYVSPISVEVGAEYYFEHQVY